MELADAPFARDAVIAGSFQCGQAAVISGHEERQARSVLKALLEAGFLVSPTARSPVRLGFPANVVERWLPKLYPLGTNEGFSLTWDGRYGQVKYQKSPVWLPT